MSIRVSMQLYGRIEQAVRSPRTVVCSQTEVFRFALRKFWRQHAEVQTAILGYVENRADGQTSTYNGVSMNPEIPASLLNGLRPAELRAVVTWYLDYVDGQASVQPFQTDLIKGRDYLVEVCS